MQYIGCLLMCMLDGNVLSQSHLCPVKPGSNHTQRTRQGLVQMDVPVQQLQLTSIKKTHSTMARSHHRGGDADRNISTCSQAFGLQKEFYASLDKRWTSRRADWPMNKTPSVLISSPLNKLLIQVLAPRWTFTGSQKRREEPSVVFLSHYDNLMLKW